MRIFLAALAAALAPCAFAQDLTVAGGHVQSNDPEGDGAAWSLRYTHDLRGPLFAGVRYLNEGHLPGHHRDGTAALIGLRNEEPWHGLVFALAAGPYRYFDTRK